MANIFDLAVLRQIEAQAADSSPPLMERAGAATTAIATPLLSREGAPPLIVCGPGNNGGDGFVVARLLQQQGFSPVLVFAGDAARLPADARAAHAAWLAVGGTCRDNLPAQTYGLAIDALFGIGLTRPITGRHAELIGQINALPCPRLALDIPSGLDAATGCIHGVAVRAERTVTFLGLKPGLLTADGPDYCGNVSVHDLDLVPAPASGQTITPDAFANCLASRPLNSHKGDFGNLAILGGAPGMAGAALLAGRAALKLGTGRVYLGMLERLPVDPLQPELMLRTPVDALAQATTLAIGPGLGQSTAALDVLRRASGTDFPLLLDADALNLLAAHPVLQGTLARRQSPTLLTPHPAEAARLLGISTPEVQADRIVAAQNLARRYHAHVVLKGCGSIVATPPGPGTERWWINTSGNAGLSSAGSGDVLTGFIAALLAQGWPATAALLAAVHLHGLAADDLMAEQAGSVGLTAGELIEPGRRILNRWITGD